jgi:rod shape-determining protein MreC
MRKKEGFWGVGFLVLFLCIVLIAFSFFGKTNIFSFLEEPASGIQNTSHGIFQNLPFAGVDEQIEKLKEENLNLRKQLKDQEKIEKENAALRDQFETAFPSSYDLIPADVIGAPGFIPGISSPDSLVLNKGSKDGLEKGLAVVFKDNLVGIIEKVSKNISRVRLTTDPSSSFTAKTESLAEGIVKGAGGAIVFENVLLSYEINAQEIVLTKGDVDENSIGTPPDLVIGRIKSVDKKASELFQKAKIESFIDFKSLSKVFVYSGIE